MVTLGTSCNGQSYRGVHCMDSQRKWLKNDRDQLIKVGICYGEVSNKSELTRFTSKNEPTQEGGRAQGKLTKQTKESKCFWCSNHRISFHGKDTDMYMLFDLMAQVYIWFTRPECPVFMSDQ